MNCYDCCDFISKKTDILDINKDKNLGNIYLDNIYNVTIISIKTNVTWLTKKSGINCGILYKK